MPPAGGGATKHVVAQTPPKLACLKFIPEKRMAMRIALLILFAFGICTSLLADDQQIFTEKPQVAPTVENPSTPTPSAPDAGPKPSWIWGDSNDRNYVLKTMFMGGSKAARLKASADNKMTIYVNGQRVASSDNWQTPVEVDVQKHLQPGENTLLAEVQNEGGPAGFVLKLTLTMPDGSQRYIVSDEQWQAAEKTESDTWVAARKLHVLGEEPWGDVFSAKASTGSQLFTVLPGFQVEHLFSVPKEELGSWVSITFDGKGRLIASDQGDKGLCRITPPAIGSDEPTKVERLDVKISSAQGMVYAFDSLYVSTNGFSGGNGLYRVKDTDGDDQFDLVEKLKDIRGGGEHGPHAVLAGPDGKSLFYLAGNFTRPPFGPAEPNPNHRSRADQLGRRPASCRGNGTPAALRSACWRRAAGQPKPIPTARCGTSSATVIAIPTTWPSTPTASCSSTTPTWNGTWALPGIARRACCTPLAAANSAGAAAPASGPHTTSIACPRSSMSARVRR